ncbi:MAG: haloacid dehalogenase-like hydrolase [Coprobacillus sp.]|nr:haloacid dehalogenase-like hydrolase [Coprobacillus sp.]
MKRSVALFDFDNTIAQGDSIKRLLKYDLKKRPWHIFCFIKVIFYCFGYYVLHFYSFEQAKSSLLFPLRSMDEDELKYFYRNYVAIHYYHHVIEEMKKRKKEGCFVIVCTASVEDYMQYHELPADCMLATLTNHGQIIGKNCKNEEKIYRINKCLKEHNIEIDYDSSYGYSDSNSDIPMLSLVKNKKRVLLKTGQIIAFKE